MIRKLMESILKILENYCEKNNLRIKQSQLQTNTYSLEDEIPSINRVFEVPTITKGILSLKTNFTVSCNDIQQIDEDRVKMHLYYDLAKYMSENNLGTIDWRDTPEHGGITFTLYVDILEDKHGISSNNTLWRWKTKS